MKLIVAIYSVLLVWSISLRRFRFRDLTRKVEVFRYPDNLFSEIQVYRTHLLARDSYRYML